MLAGIILAGGQSKRMGKEKAWLPFGPPPGTMLTEVVGVVLEVCDPVVVVAAPDQSLPELPASIQIVRDPVPEQGPLAALVTGLKALPESSATVFVCSCDIPLLQASFISGLKTHLKAGDDFVVPRDRQGRHPLAAIYRRLVLPDAKRLLADGKRSLQRLLDEVTGEEVTGEQLQELDPKQTNLLNVNTLEEYERAVRLYRR
ncbi:Molybdenum cofactor guanylyltransferase [Polystyrenella longa]|uniref:Probable molybdenum cofactor guanylyltransferase n=1 Tax=Polystyrenella longa TaxID=2528007 RepID=A0A518CGU2_9PLAN|nr:molybdenum cofactor guanylyltransferase [Polystyrenella longa]QDU78448.1 Molybdenum cofactor guanylyltransferase [Polystyrenella longa]